MQQEILTLRELKDLTGYKQNKMITKWLKRNKVKFFIAANGDPKVNRFALRQAMGVKTDTLPIKTKKEPNWNAINNNRG